METRAHYTLIGAFVVAFLLAGFGFVYWLQYAGGIGQRAYYRIRFDEPSAGGLASLSAVLFNGIRVGNVTELRLDPQNPKLLIASISVDPATPIRVDTKVEVAYQGFTGAPVLALKGGSPTSPRLTSSDGRPPVLVVGAGATQNLTDAARDTLNKLGAILDDNAKPLHTAIDGISEFADMLGRNSKRVEGLIGGLEKMAGTGDAAKAKPAIFDLAAPTNFPALDKPIKGQVIVSDPAATLVFDTQKILIRSAEGSYTDVENAQWADNLPKLMQAKIVQSFENAQQLKSVSRPIDQLESGYKLEIGIRNFQLTKDPSPSALVEFSARLIDSKGAVKEARIFKASQPAGALDGQQAVDALNKAFSTTARDLVVWTVGLI